MVICFKKITSATIPSGDGRYSLSLRLRNFQGLFINYFLFKGGKQSKNYNLKNWFCPFIAKLVIQHPFLLLSVYFHGVLHKWQRKNLLTTNYVFGVLWKFIYLLRDLDLEHVKPPHVKSG